MDIVILPTYEEARPYWEQLARTLGAAELCLDWQAHRIIWESFYAPRGTELRIYAALEAGRPVGIVPLLLTREDRERGGPWTFSDDFLLAREYFCLPSVLPRLLPRLPEHLADDLSCFDAPAAQHLESFEACPGAIADLRETQQAYFASLGGRHRRQLRAVWERNGDLSVEAGGTVRRELLEELLARYLGHWRDRFPGQEERQAYSRDKVATDLALMERAAQMGRLLALHFRLDGRLVAANFGVFHGQDRLDDYLCLRDPREQARGLGHFAILANMEEARKAGVRWYDLSAILSDYKKRFLNTRAVFYRWRGAYAPAAGERAETAVREAAS
jgi:CelD/BcsL family acetyltransferase involved in cellulose biosynthesis